jgi:endonuclease/exonuclease/phosphatase family metal-dependent hydrolase
LIGLETLTGYGHLLTLSCVAGPVLAWVVWARLFGRRWLTVIWLVLAAALVAGLAWRGGWRGPAPSFAGGSLTDPAGPRTLRVMTWNLGTSPPFGGSSQPDALDDIARTILDSGATVVCLQELAAGPHLERLMDYLGPEWMGVTAVWANKGTAVITTHRAHYVQPDPNAPFGGPTIATLRTAAGPIDVISCHAAPGRSADGRYSLAEQLADRIRRSGRPTILAGDFNLDPDRSEGLLTSRFTDNRSLDEKTYAMLTAVAPDAAKPAGATSLLGRRIDWVLATPQLRPVRAVVLDGKRRGLMDHKPVVVDLQLPVEGVGGDGQG